MIETELGLLEMQRELVTSHAMKLRQPMFGMAPKRLDAVDVSAAQRILLLYFHNTLHLVFYLVPK